MADTSAGQERKVVTILFADVIGSTALGEQLDPERLRSLLGAYFAAMASIIESWGGTVEKYIGDAIFAVWGLPDASDDDAANALRCANGMIAALDGWNAERSAAGERILAIGIGLHHGPAVIGDVGSERSLSFTVIGDTVNTASRLQALTRSLATPLVVSDELVAALRPRATDTLSTMLDGLQDRGEQILRGRSGAVRVWVRPEPTR